ncbi:rod-binding protein [Pseudooceanicola sp. C21-150M6]|uniref:rod-binding protein n=1 Tax=Pseudooceanicola sp. C21-150M6 TaxID=3434355 RepID=UPI003D7FEFF4
MDIHAGAGTQLAQAQLGLARAATQPDASVQAAREFEALFLTQVMDEMLKTVNLGDMSGGFAEETWRSFLARAYADELAARGTTGISQSVERSIGAYRAGMITDIAPVEAATQAVEG